MSLWEPQSLRKGVMLVLTTNIERLCSLLVNFWLLESTFLSQEGVYIMQWQGIAASFAHTSFIKLQASMVYQLKPHWH